MVDINETLKSTPEISPEKKSAESGEIVNRQPEAKVPSGLESFLRRIEKDPLQQSVINDVSQPQLTPSPSINPKVVLPTTRQSFLDGFLKTVDDVSLWLSRFIFREIKLKDGNVIFKSPHDS